MANPTTPRKVVAWQVQDDEGQGGIVFHSSNMAARRLGAAEFGDGDWEYHTCRRAPSFDQFAAAGHVSHLDMWRRGWWFECSQCAARIDDEFGQSPYRDKVLREEPIMVKGALFCSPWCHQRWAEYLAGRVAEKKMARSLALADLPAGCEVTHTCGRAYDYAPREGEPAWSQKVCRKDYYFADFRFPGAVNTGRWKRFDGEEPMRTISLTDLDRWALWTGKPISAENEALLIKHNLRTKETVNA